MTSLNFFPLSFTESTSYPSLSQSSVCRSTSKRLKKYNSPTAAAMSWTFFGLIFVFSSLSGGPRTDSSVK